MAAFFKGAFSTGVASIRQGFTSNENDGDTIDDTHLCRVMRTYYTNNGRALPPWLPADPKAPPPVVIQPVLSQPVGSLYGTASEQSGAGASNLNELFSSSRQQGQFQQPQSQSLRGPRGRGGRSGEPVEERRNPYGPTPVQPRPMPSSKPGSYQNTAAAAYGRSEIPPISSQAPAKVNRLRDKFASGGRASGARSASPGAGSSVPSRVADPMQRNNSYGSSGGGGNYDDRSGAGAGYGGGNRGGDRPFVAATAPWASSESEFGGGGYGGGYDPRSGARQGLPSGPAAGRRGPGLPSGPRGPR